ncbi:MAG: COR domain-containing protein, partial [Candidatus Methylumidiphilus sp.]
IEVPTEIGELVWLEELSFANEWLHDQLKERSKNTGSNNKLMQLSPHLYPLINPFSRLKNLKHLWLRGNNWGTIDLAPLSILKNLEILDVSDTGAIIFDPLAELSNLESLNISQTKIANISQISKLINLDTLILSFTKINNFQSLVGLSNLRVISAAYTYVSDLSPLKNLTNLQSLDVSHTKVNDLSPLAKLIYLQKLTVSKTEVTDLSALVRLTNIQAIDISETNVTNLAPLTNFLNLQKLDFSRTKITDILPLLSLIKRGVPVRWSRGEEGICVQDCHFNNPPTHIVNQGNEAILRYFAEKQRSDTIKVREAKLLLVGQGKAGKTTLRKKLEDPNAEMPAPGHTTRGIEITRLDEKMPQTGEPLRINVWDFGGQDIQHYAHQFFLTGNSLYALVTNERIQDSVHLPYWLNIIEMLGKKSPVLLIQNKDGGHCQALRDEAAIRARFGNVHNRVFQTDFSQAESEIEFADLRREIVHQASLLPHVERDYLASFVELRGKLEMEADRETHYLSWEDYLKLMPELSEDLLRDYANALTFFGVCQYFPNDAMLSQFVFLRPKWIIDALFALLLHPSLETKRGHFSENDTFKIWEGYEYKGMHALLVRMMEEFELCYRVEGGNHSYILPQRLPSESNTYGWDEPGDTPVQYRYKFMPKGILTRLICRLHDRIETDPERGQRVWCDAVIFTLPDGKGRVFAREVYSENTIELRASGDKRADMLNEVIRKMDDINRDAKYDNLQVDKLMPCPCEECVRAEAPGFHEYEALLKRIEKGKTTSECKKSGEDVPIDEIFGKSGVKSPLSRHGEPYYPGLRGDSMEPTRIRIFISYSHAQSKCFQIFLNDFNQFAKLPGFDIEVFSDYKIPTGKTWDEFLQTKVADCDAMILLVSQEFMNSNYIKEKEFGPALERLKSGQKLLIAPIYFSPCTFDLDKELSELQFFKPNGDMFGEARLGNKFSYTDLVKFNQIDGLLLDNNYRQHYMKELMINLRPELQQLA